MTEEGGTVFDELPIGNPCRGALAHAGFDSLATLATWTEKDVLALHGIGPKSIPVLPEALAAAAGLSFR